MAKIKSKVFESEALRSSESFQMLEQEDSSIISLEKKLKGTFTGSLKNPFQLGIKSLARLGEEKPTGIWENEETQVNVKQKQRLRENQGLKSDQIIEESEIILPKDDDESLITIQECLKQIQGGNIHSIFGKFCDKNPERLLQPFVRFGSHYKKISHKISQSKDPRFIRVKNKSKV